MRYFALCLCLLLSARIQAQTNQSPNIIFLFADDLGWGDLSCYGNQRIKTPNLDRLAAEGTLFTNFYVAGSVCSPSRAGIMTGQYPARNRIFGHIASKKINEQREMPNHLNPDVTTLADLLKRKGYRTAHFGKWHLGLEVPPGEYGFDSYRTDTKCNVPGKEPMPIWKDRPNASKMVLDQTIEFIQQQKGGPFYVNAWFNDPHAELNPSQEQIDRLKQLDKTDLGHQAVDQRFYATVLEMDHQVGIFLDKLKALGLDQNTIVIFSSDNGPEDYQVGNASNGGLGTAGPFRGRKRSIYEGGIRVPFLMRWTGTIPAGKVNDQSIIGGVDFIPSLCAIAGASVPDSLRLDGENRAKAMLGGNDQRQKPLMWEWRYRVNGSLLNHSPRLAIRDGNWKLLLNPDRSRIELYDLTKDPSELDNRATENAPIVERLAKQVLDWNQTLPISPVQSPAGEAKYPWPKGK
jgi:arylsulfatase A-like enzyme